MEKEWYSGSRILIVNVYHHSYVIHLLSKFSPTLMRHTPYTFSDQLPSHSHFPIFLSTMCLSLSSPSIPLLLCNLHLRWPENLHDSGELVEIIYSFLQSLRLSLQSFDFAFETLNSVNPMRFGKIFKHLSFNDVFSNHFTVESNLLLNSLWPFNLEGSNSVLFLDWTLVWRDF